MAVRSKRAGKTIDWRHALQQIRESRRIFTVCDSSFRPHDARLRISETRPSLVFVTVGSRTVRHTRGSASPCRLRRGSRGDARPPLPRWLRFFAREAFWSARATSSARAWSGCVSLPNPPGPQSSRSLLSGWCFWLTGRDGVMGARPASRRAARGSRAPRLAKSNVTASGYHPRRSRARLSAATAPMRARFSRHHLGFLFHGQTVWDEKSPEHPPS